MVALLKMNEVQVAIGELKKKGWNLAEIAEKLGLAHVTIEKWKSGARYPANSKTTIAYMNSLKKLKRDERRGVIKEEILSTDIGSLKIEGKKLIKFTEPLCKEDAESQTLGCRQNNSDICKKNGLREICAFMRPDSICKSPSNAWAKQYRKLVPKGNPDEV